MRPHDLTAVALGGVALLVAVQAAWQPPTIAPGEAHEHIGERVRVEGIVTDVTLFPDGAGLLRIAAEGHGLQARFQADPGVDAGAWVRATGQLERSDGLPLLRIEQVHASRPPETRWDDIERVAAAPDEHADRWLRLRGSLEGSRLVSEGHTMPLADATPARGPHDATGVLVYEPRCLCYQFLLHEARPWTP